MNKISIIIPIYNSERYLARCIDSVIAQDYKNLEIILVNDGSTDNSAAICKDYAKKDKRIVYISEVNSGSAHARNVGIAKATGSYITFVDSDDYIDKSHIMHLQEKIDGKTIVQTGLAEDAGYVLPYKRINKKVSISEWFYMMALEIVHIGTVSKLIPRNVATSQLFPEKVEVGEDATYYYRLAKEWQNKDLYVVVKTDIRTYHYVKNENSITRGRDAVAYWDKNLDVFRNMMRSEKKNSALYNAATCAFCLTALSILIRNFKSCYYDASFGKKIRSELLKYKKVAVNYFSIHQRIKLSLVTRMYSVIELLYKIKKRKGYAK